MDAGSSEQHQCGAVCRLSGRCSFRKGTETETCGNSYKKIERAIIAFVSVIGLSFIYELFLVRIDWPVAVQGWVTPSFPQGSMLIIMSVLGAVVMPHNLFLHSEVIQSHEYNKQDDASIRRVLKYELFDTLFSMIVGWAINSAMILLAAATFFKGGIQVEELQQAKSLLDPLLGSSAGVVFALALLMAGISSTITSGMAAGSIFAGIFGESYHIRHREAANAAQRYLDFLCIGGHAPLFPSVFRL